MGHTVFYNGKEYSFTPKDKNALEVITTCLKTKPYQHQVESLEYSIDHKKFLLADEQGLGKSLSSLEIALYNKKQCGYKHCLIICGVNGLKYNWFNEVKQHTTETAHILGQRKTKNGLTIGSNKDKLDDLLNLDNLPYFIITNIESLRYKIKTGNIKKVHGKNVEEVEYPIINALNDKSDSINMIIADECHKMKNPESEQGKQFLNLSADSMIAMTGTPIMNNPLDLFIILKWLGYEEHSFFQFKVHYCRMGGFGGYEVVGYKNLEQLQIILDRMMLRRLKSDVLDLPEKIYMTEYVEMSTKQEKIYDEIKDDLLCNIDKIKINPSPLSELIRLRQATGYTGILSSTVKESAKLDRLVELVDDIVQNDQKVLIFSNWTSMTDIIAERLDKYKPDQITGKVSDQLRDVGVRRFQHSPCSKVLIGTIGAMGTGLTLTAATNVIFFDHPWTAAMYDQAVDRCHRIGTKHSVNVYNLITKDTIDERIFTLLEQKRQLSDAIIDNKVNGDTIKYLLS